MSDIFISYNRADRPTARLFAAAFEREGFSVWWDQALNAGETFDTATEQALEKARAVVVLWSRKSVESRWVRAEATQAQANHRLVPVMIEPCKRPIMFELTHTADLCDWADDADDPRWRTLVDGLRRLVAAPEGSQSSAAAVAAAASSAWRPARHKRVHWSMAAALSGASTVVGALAVWWLAQDPVAVPSLPTVRLTLPFFEPPAPIPFGVRHLAISRDGSRVAFASTNRLWMRRLDQQDATALWMGPVGNPFFSPDGRWVAAFRDDGLFKVPVESGAAVRLSPTADRHAGGTWHEDGTIVYATTEGLYAVSEDGGEARLLAEPNPDRGERAYAWPEFLPDGTAVLFTVVPEVATDGFSIALLDLRTHEIASVLAGATSARYLSGDRLVYAAGSALHVAAFDPVARRTTSDPVTLPDFEVATAADNGAASFALSDSGTLVYLAPRGELLLTPVWVDRAGNQEPLALPPHGYASPRISPDGTRVAFDMIGSGNRDAWTLDLDRLTLSRLTDGPTEDVLPVWAPNGQRVYFSSNRTGNFDIYSQAADGASGARVEYAGPGTQIITSFVPDGSGLLIYENYADTHLLRLAQPERIEPLLANPEFDQRIPVVSPDGRWIAYESDESGTQFEIFLRPYPNVNERREKVSLDGGRFPVWGPPDSHELYYLAADGAMMAVAVITEPDLVLGRPTKLFDWAPPPASRSGTPYDVSPLDGRFLMVKALGARDDEPTYVSVVLNGLPWE